jgi:subtilisin family serine protease
MRTTHLKKKITMSLALMLTLVMSLGFLPMFNGSAVASASGTEQRSSVGSTEQISLKDTTRYTIATLDDNFADDVILVVLTRNASRNFTTLTTRDFPEVELTDVICITPGLEQAQAQIKASLSTRESSFYYDSRWSLDINQFRQILKLKLANPGRENVLSAIRVLEIREDVYSAGPNMNLPGGSFSENDSTLYSAGATLNSTDPTLWNLNKINLAQAHGITSGASTVRVGVLSTGIDATRPDLGGGRLYSVTPLGANQPTGSQNFHPTDTSTPLTDPAGHGTHIAGTIVGATTGVAPGVKLVSLKVATGPNTSGWYDFVAIIQAIRYAGQNDPVRGGIRIPILSLSPDTWASYADMEQAILNYTGLFVMGAGNHGREIHRPGDFNALRGDRIITVGASDQNDGKAVFSNFGATTVDIFAPGVNIRSTVPLHVSTTGYANWSGTSHAAPMVTGVIALMYAAMPPHIIQSPASVKQHLLNSADRVPSLNGLAVTGGRLNAYAAVRAICETINFTGQTVTNNTAVTSCGTLNANNVTVTPTGILNIRATERVNIGSGFTVQPGGSLIIQVP